MWRYYRRRKKVRKKPSKHYLNHKETARALIYERLYYFNGFYNYQFGRVAVKNQKRCWGSCSSLKNLNFNYKIIFLPGEVRDYVILHELCHLKEMNHSKDFWNLLAYAMPDYDERRKKLKVLERLPMSRWQEFDDVSKAEPDHYLSGARG